MWDILRAYVGHFTRLCGTFYALMWDILRAYVGHFYFTSQ